MAVDVAGYVGETDDQPAELYAGVWVKKARETEDARIYAGAAYADHKTVYGELEKQGFKFHHSLQGYRGLDGQQKYCGVKSKATERGNWSWNHTTSQLEAKEYFDKIAWDLDPSNAPRVPSTKERNQQELAAAEAQLEDSPTNLSARYARGKAYFYLGQDEQALEDMDFLVEKAPRGSGAYQFRSLLHARMGKTEEAKTDLAKFQDMSQSPHTKAYLDAIVSA